VDKREDLVGLVLKYEVARVEKMELEVPQVSLMGCALGSGKMKSFMPHTMVSAAACRGTKIAL
jgi:hypothetical protein